MKYTALHFKILFVYFTLSTIVGVAQKTAEEAIDLNKVSEQLLQRTRDKEATGDIQDRLAKLSIKDLENGLTTNNQKLAFWVNIYNAYIQIILQENPDLYKNRRSFFDEDQITIAGETVSFGKIEHGIIRQSQSSIGLGLIGNWFPDEFERKLRVDEQDYRIHFALNCGAKDCPPVAVYTAANVNEQFAKGTKRYLKKTTDYDKESNTVAVTSLFSWFRGDFGSKSGILKILKNQGLIPTTKGVSIDYKNYDWTLDLDNWIDL